MIALRRPFLTWVFFEALVVTGLFWLYQLGVITKMWAADWTHIITAIGVWFILATLACGWVAYRVESARALWGAHQPMSYHRISIDLRRDLSFVWFSASQMLNLGLAGTTIGFIGMLTVAFSNHTMSADTIGTLIPLVGENWATALYATASAIVCSVILQIQGYAVNYALELKET